MTLNEPLYRGPRNYDGPVRVTPCGVCGGHGRHEFGKCQSCAGCGMIATPAVAVDQVRVAADDLVRSVRDYQRARNAYDQAAETTGADVGHCDALSDAWRQLDAAVYYYEKARGRVAQDPDEQGGGNGGEGCPECGLEAGRHEGDDVVDECQVRVFRCGNCGARWHDVAVGRGLKVGREL